MSLIEELRKRCGNCDHLRECGCLNAYEVATFYHDGGITVRVTDEGTVTPLIDIRWCPKWLT